MYKLDFNQRNKDIAPEREAFFISTVYFGIAYFSAHLMYKIYFVNLLGEVQHRRAYFNFMGISVALTSVLIFILVFRKISKINHINKMIYSNLEKLSITNQELISVQEELKLNSELTNSLINNSHMIIYTWDLDCKILSFNQYGEKVTGYKESELIGKSWVDLFIKQEDKERVKGLIKYLKSGRSLKNSIGDIWFGKDGSFSELIWTDIPVKDEKNVVTKILSIGNDITAQKRLVKSLNDQAYYDKNTKLPNLYFMNKQINEIIQLSDNNSKMAFLDIDVDNFKQLNDSLGYDLGNKLLIHLAELLKSDDENYILGKSVEDEYSLVIKNIESKEDVIEKVEEILKKINQIWDINGHKLMISSSIGISIYPDDGNNFETLMKLANMAMYTVKSKGKNGYAFYDSKIGDKISHNIFLTSQIGKAIENKEFFLHYQPVFNFNKNYIEGAECLIRWIHPTHGYISPADFIPLVEETGQIVELTSLVLDMAFEEKSKLNKLGYKDKKISVNLSSKSLLRGMIDEEIKNLMDKYDISPEELIVEVTETSFMNNLKDCIATLNKIKELGISIALDDFGTGYSSLSQLKKLPIDKVKIDQEFIKNMEIDSEEKKIVESIIELSHVLGLDVVAEGVETKDQIEFLKEHNCDFGQGYHISKPMEYEKFKDLLAKDKVKGD